MWFCLPRVGREREGTFTSGERRIQRYYPGIPAVGECRPDWQILAEVGERVGLGKPPFAASLVFRDISKAVPQYKGMNYRTLAHVEEQWPDVGGEDLYYGGTAYENRAGLGQQWAAAAESGEVNLFDVPETETLAKDGLKVMWTAALYTPGTLIDQSVVLNPRKAHPTLVLAAADAESLGVANDDVMKVTMMGTAVEVRAYVNGATPAGLALLHGVPHIPGTDVAQITKIGEKETV